MIVFVLTKLFAWMYGVELSHSARITFFALSFLESITVIVVSVIGYFVGRYESQNKRGAK